MTAQKRVLSGVQPSGNLHIGNWLGAIRSHVEESKVAEEGTALFFIADLHALTSVYNRDLLKQYVREVAAAYIALGLDTKRAIFFRQSDLAGEICTLYWLLNTCTNTGLMDRAPAFKEKVAKGLTANLGLYSYPMLMSADILIFRSTHVPTGADQLIHLEIAADVATHFNSTYNPEFPLTIPRPVISESGKVLGVDGEKMSKSYGNSIPIFAEPREIKRLVSSIKTDSRPPEEPKDPESVLPYLILDPFLSADERPDIRSRLQQGKIGYGDLKGILVEKIETTFREPRERFKELMAKPGGLDLLLYKGAARARKIAHDTLSDCLHAVGLESAAIQVDEIYMKPE